MLKNLREFIAAKEEVNKLQEENKAMGAGFIPPAAEVGEDEEYDIGLNENKGKKEEEEYNIGDGGLDEFMTSLKQGRASETSADKGTKEEESKAVRKTAGVKPTSSKMVENDNEILGFAQGASPQKSGTDEFENLFGNAGPSNPRPVPTAMATSYPQPRVPEPGAADKKPGNAYDQFAAYFTTYQQPGVRPPPANYFAQPQINSRPPAKATSPFDEAESKYSRADPTTGVDNESW